MADIAFEIGKAIGAHGLWKSRLRIAAETRAAELDPAAIGREDGCDFGRFLAAPALQPLFAAPPHAAHHRRVRELHARFHRCACAVAEAARAGNRLQAEALMRANGEFGLASADLTRAMMAWQQDCAKAA